MLCALYYAMIFRVDLGHTVYFGVSVTKNCLKSEITTGALHLATKPVSQVQRTLGVQRAKVTVPPFKLLLRSCLKRFGALHSESAMHLGGW